MTFLRTYTIFPLYGFCICIDSASMGQSTPTTAFDGAVGYFVMTALLIQNFRYSQKHLLL